MNPKLQSLYGLKFNPFRPDVPVEALYATPTVDAFLRRVQLGIADGGYIMICGGTVKSVVLRLLTQRLQALRDVMVGTIEHPQSRTMDFYRELGDLFAVPLGSHNRWGGFKSLRSRWAEHIASTMTRPVLIIDEAQEALTAVFNELRVLASKDLDSRQLSASSSLVMPASSSVSEPPICSRSVAVSAVDSFSNTHPATNCSPALTICSRSLATRHS